MRYFAYGSNLCRSRLLERVPSARFDGIARLPGYTLRFHKIGRDGSGKADAYATGKDDDVVWGALVRLPGEDWSLLDGYEPGYDRLVVNVEVSDSATPMPVATYVARPESIDPARKPFTWYRQLIVEGGAARGLPAAYLRRIAGRPASTGGPATHLSPEC